MVHLLQSIEVLIKEVDVPQKVTSNSSKAVTFKIKADSSNTSICYIGGSSPTYPLEQGASEDGIGLPILDEIFVKSATAGDKIHILIYEDPHIHNIREIIFQAFGQTYFQNRKDFEEWTKKNGVSSGH